MVTYGFQGPKRGGATIEGNVVYRNAPSLEIEVRL